MALCVREEEGIVMYEGMDEYGRPIPKIRRASLLASQSTVPLHKSTVPLHTRRTLVRKRVQLIPAPQVPLKKRPFPTWITFLVLVVAFAIVLNSAWALVSR